MHDEWPMVEARLRRALNETIAPARFPRRVPLDVLAWEVDGEPVPVEDALAAPFTPFSVGSMWGRPWGTTWFRIGGTVPPEFSGQRVVARIDLGFSNMVGFQSEGQIWAVDDSGRHVPLRGLHPKHHDVLVGDPVVGGEEVSLLIEAASNPPLVWQRPDPNSDLPTAATTPIYSLAGAHLVVVDAEVAALWDDIEVVSGLRSHLSPTEPRHHELGVALSAMLDALDLGDVSATAAAARVALEEVLARPAVPSAHQITAVGHAHIDTAWLWPLRETVRKCARTFSNVDRLMDDYPELRFVCSQAQQYAWMEEFHPALFDRISARVAEGRWIPVGGMWVEADANLSGGEALLRQFIHGQRYFEDRFGSRCDEVWLPDVFGYPANLPQLMRLAGIDRFLTQKLSWNETNDFPHHSFWWEGIDGSTVFTHFPPVDTYNAEFSVTELTHAVGNFRDKGRSTRSLMPFGWGDGGGGPTAQMMERFRRSNDLEGLPRVEIGSPAEFFDAAIAEYPDAPRWVGELYFEKHRGTFTSQADTKSGNRRCERLLREAELFSAMAHGLDGCYPHEVLDDAWRVVLVNQFHDILPGSSIGWVHREAAEAYEEVAATLESVIADALVASAGGAAAVANATPSTRREVVVVGDAAAAPPGGQDLGSGRRALLVDAPPLSLGPLHSVEPRHTVSVDERGLRNGKVSVRLDDSGHLASFVDETTGRDAFAPGAPGNVLQLLDDRPAEFDAWDISSAGDRRRRDVDRVDSVDVVEAGPLVGSIRVTRRDGPSTFVETLRLAADSPRLDITVEVDWRHRDTLLKAAFPVDLNTTDMTREIQYGHYTSPIHTNTTWDTARFEVCAHRWVSLTEGDFGIALLNDSKYGHDARRLRGAGDRPLTELRISLLRGTGYPDPVADEGGHRFTYSLMHHHGDPVAAGVVSEAYALAGPLRVLEGGADQGPPRRRLPHVVAENGRSTEASGSVMVEVVKAADDRSGDLVLRCYESGGRRVEAEIDLAAWSASAVSCDIYEDPLPEGQLTVEGGRARLGFSPFEVRTVRCAAARS